MVMTEQFLYYTNSEPNIYYTESEINFKKKQNLQKDILIMEAEIKTDKIIYLLFLQQNREEDKFNIETFKLKLQYEISFVNFLKNGERDEQQLNKVNELAMNYLEIAENFKNSNYLTTANNLKNNYEYMLQVLQH
jgi:hypothetical protein